MLSANTNQKNLEIKSSNSIVFKAIEKIEGDVNYCQIEKISSNFYASVCLSYYYRTTYLLSLFKFNDDKFEIYTYNSDEYKNLQFALLKRSQISLLVFNEINLGIFYRDIDDDSMIHVFYPNCGNNFDKVPKGNSITSNCDLYSTDLSSSKFYFDECSHKFLEPPTGYTIYEKNQFCQIKNIQCDNNNYFLDIDNEDKEYICRKKDDLRRNYYFDSDETNDKKKFKKCFRSCLTCSSSGNEDSNNCNSCDTDKGFYPFNYDGFSNDKQCLHKDVPIEKYYFDNGFQKCRKECLTCSEYPSNLPSNEETDDTKDTKCLKCNTNDDYFPQIDKPSNCILKTRTDFKYHYYNDDYKRWEKCTDGCIYCSEYGESIDETNCLKVNDDYCDTNKDYYPVENDDPTDTTNINNKCFQKNKRYDYYYYFEGDQKIFKKCDVSCLQCDNNNACLPDKCDIKNKYFPREDDHTICLNQDTQNNFYYFDPNTKLFKKCHESCLQCKEQIDISDDDTQCSRCNTDSDYYPLDGSDNIADNINCYHKGREGYYFKDNKMYKCPEKCSKCEYIRLTSSENKNVFCTECNNELKFYQIENTYLNYMAKGKINFNS